MLLRKSYYHLTKEGVRPSKPVPRVTTWVNHTERLMDQVVSRLSLQTLQTVLYLELILSSQDLSDDCQGPDIVRGSVGTPNPTDFTAFEEVGIGFRENVSSSVDIDWVAFLNELKVRQRK